LQEEEDAANTSVGAQDSEGDDLQEHDLAAFAGIKVSDKAVPAKGRIPPFLGLLAPLAKFPCARSA